MESSLKTPYSTWPFKVKNLFVLFIVYLFVALFVYTASSKLIGLDSFIRVLGRTPGIGRFNVFVGWAVPITEIAISILLIIPSTAKRGLIASLILMCSFTLYLIYMLSTGEKLPCSCGGVVSLLNWKEHIWFNIGLIILAALALRIWGSLKNLRA